MEYRKNADIVKLLFKMKSIKKAIIGTSHSLKTIKVSKGSMEDYNTCHNLFQEGSCQFFQCCGFLKSQYFGDTIPSSAKRFLIGKLYIPAYKNFLELRQNLSLLQVEEIYELSLQSLKRNVENINNSLSSLLGELNKI